MAAQTITIIVRDKSSSDIRRTLQWRTYAHNLHEITDALRIFLEEFDANHPEPTDDPKI